MCDNFNNNLLRHILGISDVLRAETSSPSTDTRISGETSKIGVGECHKVNAASKSSTTLPFHILQTSQKDIRLLANIQFQAPVTNPFGITATVCREALKQEIPVSFPLLANIERLNMIVQIPEISAIAVANQTGRVALLTLTKSTKPNSQYAFRIDWLLPFKSQEDQGQRPPVPLLGMAVGPIQGHESPYDSGIWSDSVKSQTSVESKRYRLFLTYYDHTIMTYEIWRSFAEDEDQNLKYTTVP